MAVNAYPVIVFRKDLELRLVTAIHVVVLAYGRVIIITNRNKRERMEGSNSHAERDNTTHPWTNLSWAVSPSVRTATIPAPSPSISVRWNANNFFAKQSASLAEFVHKPALQADTTIQRCALCCRPCPFLFQFL